MILADVVLGCDVNAGNDQEVQDTVAKALEKQGHNVEKLPIAPGPFSVYSYSSKANGKIGVYIIADGIFSIADLAFGNTSFKYGYFIIRGDLGRPRMSTREHFENNPIGRDPDCTSICDKIAGKSYSDMNEICKDRCQIVFGTTAEEMASELVKAMGGDTSDDSKKKESSQSSPGTVKEALKKAIGKWDGEAEVNLRGDTVYVNKIPDPTTTKLVLNEYDNIIYDSITVTDVIPSTINTLILTFKEYELKITDDALIKRFGEVKKTIKAPKDIKKLKSAKAYLIREWNKLRRDNGRQVELKVQGDMKWVTGKWARVYIPSFFIDDYMYISKTSHEEDGTNNYLISLTLVDYPPKLSSEDSSEKENKKEKDNEKNKEESS